MKLKPLISRLAAVAVVAGALAAGEANAIAPGDTQMTIPTTVEAQNRALVEEAFARWSAGTGSPYDLLDNDVSWTIVGRSDASRTYPSKEAFMRDVIRPFNARMSQGLRPTIRQLTTDADKVIIFFDAAGVAKDGKPYENTYAWFWEMRDGRVVRAHAFYDTLTFNDFWRRLAP